MYFNKGGDYKVVRYREIKKCPKCYNTMIKISGDDIRYTDGSLADKWKCPNHDCGYEESNYYFNRISGEEYDDNY